MGSRTLQSAALLLAGAVVGVRSDVPFMTELDIFSQLAPCVTSGVTNAYLWEQDTTACGSEPTKLQSCICTNSAELGKMSASIRSAVSSRCGTKADDDQSSAAALVDKYCHPDRTITFSTPTTNIIPGVMSDVAAISSLPPCVQSGISAAVTAAAYDGCPTVANMWAPCVCSKKNVVDQIGSSLGQQVRSSCSNADDVTLASSFYTQFCAMNQGTTSFGAMPGPPGDMTYYITALPQFSSLHSCAQSGVIQAVMSQSTYLCASGPQALASCVCLKPGILGKASQSLTSSVKYACDNTALADVASAASVLDYYCQAAQKKVVATVSQSISETKATATTAGGQATRQTSGSAPENTSGGGGGGGGGGGSGRGGLGRGAIIAIAVLGALVVIGLIAFVAIFVRRRKRKAAAATDAGEQPPHPPHSELATNSPSSEIDGKPAYPPPSISEVAATPSPYQRHTELSAGTPHQQHQAVSPSELSSPGAQSATYGGANNPHNPNQNWAPPGQVMYELDSSSPAAPHAK
ncbi:hypothetical protein ISF_08982 [Cordyceps fumosorosea ARSEF 2679]|uniref:Uncharacterized protein n=1 Tax=Cordyceps fumosorosea (strain ARSEF 2679) TaxID=1081104 RepID=A0A167LIW9_CORFA|nr:hypothetical protein ISF_08982 [Cordyceps fumosorosea ARSEF 2679]OAA53141.1 hypothetical protein ISF_08982 [Cordyceps fumosorosea ARSEF 2679]